MKRIDCGAPLVLAAIMTLTYGCSDTAPTKVADGSSEIWPLAVGNRWITRQTRYDFDDSVISVDYDTVTVLRDTVIGGETFYIMNTFQGMKVINRRDGFWFGTSMLVFNYPASIGTVTGYTAVVESVDTLITVPMGVFRCYAYVNRRDNGIARECNFLSPGVGLVLSEESHGVSGGRGSKTELISATIR